jgi:hypothetical protein
LENPTCGNKTCQDADRYVGDEQKIISSSSIIVALVSAGDPKIKDSYQRGNEDN